jgi:tetratricopeptide (TPR) repeat protein
MEFGWHFIRLLILGLINISTSLFSSNFLEASNPLKFECPYQCGTWGSPSLLSIEWDFVLVLHHVDQLLSTVHYYEDEDYIEDFWDPNVSYWLERYPPPINENSSWYKHIINESFYCRNHPEECDFCFCSIAIETPDRKGLASWSHWGIKHFEDSQGAHLGKIFTRQEFLGIINNEQEERLPMISYRFDNYIDFHQACEDLKDDIEWYYLQGYQYENDPGPVDDRPVMVEYYKNFHEKIKTLENKYHSIFTHCSQDHHAPSAYYQNALHDLKIGDISSSLENLRELYKLIDIDTLSSSVASAICQTKGYVEMEIGYYDQAILDLGKAIEKDPNCNDAYFLRAIAQFERGNFKEAINDYSKSNVSVTPLDETLATPIKKYTSQEVLQFSTGIIEGVTSGSLQSLQEFIPSTLNSLWGLANGLWAFALHPKQVSIEMLQAANNIINFINSHDFLDTISIIIPEIQELRQQRLSPYQKGQLIGKIIGRYGVDILMCSGSVKGIKAVMELKRANAALSLKVLSKQLGKTEAFSEISQQWWKNTAPIIDEIKLQKGKLGENLCNAFKTSNLNEHQIRKILNHAGIQTFARPKGIPQSYKVSISKKHGGMVYTHPTNPHISIRVSPGNPNSINSAQRTPYIVHKTPKGPLDKKGKIHKKDDIEVHIPIEEYDFTKLTKILPIDE